MYSQTKIYSDTFNISHIITRNSLENGNKYEKNSVVLAVFLLDCLTNELCWISDSC